MTWINNNTSAATHTVITNNNIQVTGVATDTVEFTAKTADGSSNVVTVNVSDIVTAVALGTKEVIVQIHNGIQVKSTIMVKTPVNTIAIDPVSIEIDVNVSARNTGNTK